MNEITEFTILQLKSQLESSLENTGSQSKESLKLLLQYSRMLSSYAEQQTNNKAITILNQAFKMLLPDKPPKLLSIQFQYWRLLIMTAIKLCKALEINGQLQQGLNVLIQIENITKQYNKSLEWALNVELEYLYYHLAIIWEKLQNKERTFYAANECILLLKSNLKNKAEQKQIHMIAEMLKLQSQTKNSIHQQLSYFNQIHFYQSKYLGDNHKETIKTIMRINQLKSEIQFEKEIEEFSKEDFKKKLPFQEVSQIDFYGEEKSFNLEQQQQQQQTKQFDSKEYLRQRLFNQQKQLVIHAKNNSQSKSSLRISHQSKKSLEDFKRFTDTKINLKINSRTSSSGDNKFYYFLNVNNLQGRTKTETTQYRTTQSKNQDRLTPQGIPSQQFRCKTNKSNVSLNNTQNQQELNSGKNVKDDVFKDLMTQRPKSSIAQQRLAKQLQMTIGHQVIANKKSSQQIQLSNSKPIERMLKKLNTQELNLKKRVLNLQQPIQHSEVSTKKSNQAQEIVFGPQSQKSINLVTSGDDHTQKRSDLDLFEYNLEKIIKIQRFFRFKLKQFHNYDIKHEKINLNKFSVGFVHEDEDKFADKTPALRGKSNNFKFAYQRSNTSSVESIKFASKRDNFLQPQLFQYKQKDHSFNSQASSKLINQKSGSNSQINEQSSESLQDFEQQVLNIDKKWFYEEYIQGQCFFFCDDQADQIMRLLKFKVKFLHQNEDDNISLLCELEIEKGFQSHIIILPIVLSMKNWKLYAKMKGLQFFLNLLKEFVEQNFPIIPQTTKILIYKGQYFDMLLESIIQLISVIMKNICSERKLVGVKLYYTKDVQIKKNRKMIQQYYQKQRQEQKQYYFKSLQFFMNHYDIRINKRASSIDLNLKSLMGNEIAKQKLKAAENAVLFAIKAKTSIQNQPPKPPVIPLMLFDDDNVQSPQILEVSMRDPDVNRMQLKNIINPQKRRQSIQEQEMNRFSNLFQQNQKVHHQRNHSNLTPKKTSDSIFKKTFTIETNLLQQKILTRPQTIIQQVDQSFSSKSQQSQTSSNNQSKDHDLQPPSISHSVSLSQQPPPSFKKKNVGNVSQSQQGNTTNSVQNLLDTQQNLVAHQLFDTQALEGLELIPEQENELEQKIITIYQKDDHFTVSPQWKIKRKATIHNFQFEYFWNQHKQQKKVFQKIYNNPFNIKEILMVGTQQIDKQYFLISVTQILKEQIQIFNQSVLNNKELVKIQITYRLAYPYDNVWQDSIVIKFKEFIKWFVPDFELSSYIQYFGLSKNQKIQALSYLGRYAHIKESKIKLEYYEEKRNKNKIKQHQRRDIEISRMKQIEGMLIRDNMDLYYIQILGLNNLYQELLKERKILEEKIKRKEERLRLFLQLTDPNKLDPTTQQPKYIGYDYDGDSEEKTIQVPLNLQMQILKSYNTVVYLKQQKQIIKIQSTYLIWEGDNIKMWRPFQRKIWQQVKIENKDKLINAIQCKLRNYILKQIIVKILSLNGKKYIIKQQKQFVQNNSSQELLYQYFQLKQFSNQQFYKFLSILRVQLLQLDDCSHLWNSYFKQYKQLQHCYISQIGDCLLEIIVLIDNFAQVLNQNLNRYVFIRINIYEKQNMKTKMHKLVLTLDDLHITSKKQYDLNNENITQIIFDDVQKLMHKYVSYENQGVTKHPTLVIKNSKLNRTFKLVNSLPWLHNFNYDEFQVTLYPQKFQFYHPQGLHPKIICKVVKFLKIPQVFSKRHHSFYDNYEKQYDKLQEDFTFRVPCIITIEKFQEISSFYIYIYFPQFCRRFITKLHFDDILINQDFNLKLNFQFKEQLRIHRSEKLWQSLIESFKIVINDQKKLILQIEKFKLSCILQEVVYQKIKQIEKSQESILFIVNIEKKIEQDPEQLLIHYPFERMKLQEAKNYSMFLKLQWLNQYDNIQSYRLPLYELMIGYFEKTIKGFNMFDYKFKLVDLIRMCQISVENIIMNFSMNQTINYNNTLDQLMPQQLTYNINQTIKLNINLKTIQVDKSMYKLLYRGVLLRKPSILVGIYQKLHKQQLYFYIQRAKDCESFIHKIRFQEIENIYPGFQLNLQINQRSIGPNIFKILKNRLIVQSYYQLN
ncbi:unnamed protein product [Paramecium pentaurelia]|uniref:Uncharacterized protein n=1 Tax=Paramecium pentaurelia TaxID=43138 RepID=A0A8S1U518_9CILI|nr:unnamed protein product [Paramecium pentaurelia]